MSFRTREDIRRVNTGKTILLIIIAMIIVLLLLRSCGQTPVAANPTPVAQAEATDTPAPTAAPTEPAATAEIPELPAPPAVDALENATALVGRSLTLSGTGVPNTKVEVLANGTVLGEAAVDAAGTWRYDALFDSPGNYTITARATTADGTTQESDSPLPLTVREPTPIKLTSPAASATPGVLTFAGTAEPSSTVELLVDGAVVGTAEVDADGNWSLPYTFGSPGDYTITLNNLAADGSTLTASDPTRLTIAAAAPTLDTAEATLSLGETTLSGTATPNSTVEVTLNGEVVGTAEVDTDGRWSLPITFAEAGEVTLGLRSLNGAGEEVGNSETTITVSTPLAEPPAPTLNDPGSLTAGAATLTGTGLPGSTVQISVDGEPRGEAAVGDDGSWSFDTTFEAAGDYAISLDTLGEDGSLTAGTGPRTVSVAAAESGNTSSATTGTALRFERPSNQSVVTASKLFIQGVGRPGSTLEILDDGSVIQTLTSPPDGRWSYNYAATAGDHRLTARYLNQPQSEVGPVRVSLNQREYIPCDNPVAGQDLGDRYIVGTCEWLIRIANQLGLDIADILALNPDIRDPNIIHEGQVIRLPAR